jgi:hypothetical protein
MPEAASPLPLPLPLALAPRTWCGCCCGRKSNNQPKSINAMTHAMRDGGEPRRGRATIRKWQIGRTRGLSYLGGLCSLQHPQIFPERPHPKAKLGSGPLWAPQGHTWQEIDPSQSIKTEGAFCWSPNGCIRSSKENTAPFSFQKENTAPWSIELHKPSRGLGAMSKCTERPHKQACCF